MLAWWNWQTHGISVMSPQGRFFGRVYFELERIAQVSKSSFSRWNFVLFYRHYAYRPWSVECDCEHKLVEWHSWLRFLAVYWHCFLGKGLFFLDRFFCFVRPVCRRFLPIMTNWIRGCGGIGRLIGFRFQRASVQVRVLSSAPNKKREAFASLFLFL